MVAGWALATPALTIRMTGIPAHHCGRLTGDLLMAFLGLGVGTTAAAGTPECATGDDKQWHRTVETLAPHETDWAASQGSPPM
jgi:hypothetical protein